MQASTMQEQSKMQEHPSLEKLILEMHSQLQSLLTQTQNLLASNANIEQRLQVLETQQAKEKLEATRTVQECKDVTFYERYFSNDASLVTALVKSRNDPEAHMRICKMIDTRVQMDTIFGEDTIMQYARFCESRGRFRFFHQYLEDPNLKANVQNWMSQEELYFFRDRKEETKNSRILATPRRYHGKRDTTTANKSGRKRAKKVQSKE
jgi:hypothetical protein